MSQAQSMQGQAAGSAAASHPVTLSAEELAMLGEVFGPNIFEAAANHAVPSDAWEYHMRKSLNDAAYRSLDYVPYCSTMPVQPGAPTAKFMWKKKGQ